MQWGITVMVVGLAFLGACSFDSRSNGFACDTDGTCPEGRVCQADWCVVPTVLPPDAEVPVIDAAPDAEPDAEPVDLCIACEGGTCQSDCTVAQCAYECLVAGCSCSFSCAADSMKCNGTCAAGTTCTIDCGMGKQCHPTCQAGSICDIDCTGVKDCKRVSCEGDAECILNCANTGAPDCLFDVCGGVEQSCPNDIKVCGRDCP